MSETDVLKRHCKVSKGSVWVFNALKSTNGQAEADRNASSDFYF